MKTEILSFRKIVITGIYALLIFSLLLLIRSQNKHLTSKEIHKTPVQQTALMNAA